MLTANTKLKSTKDYLEELRKEGASPNTLKAYFLTLSLFSRFVNGREPSQENAQEFLDSLLSNGESARSLGRHAAALRGYFKFLKMPVELRTPKVTKKLPKWLTKEEVDRLITKAEEFPEEKALVLALYGGGLRVSEALNLKVEDIDPQGFLRLIGKGGNEFRVPVEEDVINALLSYAKKRGVKKGKIFPFGSLKAQKLIKGLCRAAKVKEVTPHVLRHSAASHLYEDGADFYKIKEFLRHRSISTTLDIYTHLSSWDLKRSLPKLIRK